jgi:hypothetical protein
VLWVHASKINKSLRSLSTFLAWHCDYLFDALFQQKARILKTMEFVEQYLALPSVWSFENKEQNLLTYEVMMTSSSMM